MFILRVIKSENSGKSISEENFELGESYKKAYPKANFYELYLTKAECADSERISFLVVGANQKVYGIPLKQHRNNYTFYIIGDRGQTIEKL